MRPKHVRLSLFLILLSLAGTGVASMAWVQSHDPEEREVLTTSTNASTGSCGVERWSVKTGTDADVGLVNLNSTTATTISYLTGLPAPSTLPANNRIQPTETTQFVLSATLTEYKLENDSDYHLVIQDASGNTMIAEIPDPACVGSGSPFTAGIQTARQEFDNQYSTTTSFQTANIPVCLTGVGFFDFNHGQTGVAPNAIELHPVLDVKFNPTSCNGGGSASPPTASDGSISTSANTAVNGTLSASGTAPLTYAIVANPAHGSVALSNASTGAFTYTPASGYTGSDSFTFDASNSGGTSNVATESVTVNPAGGGGNVLQNGVPATGLSAAQGQQLNFTLSVPTGATGLSFQESGGTGTADLYVRFGTPPTTTTYDCRQYPSGGSATCAIATAQAGTYYVMLNAYTAFSGWSLTGSYTASGGGGGGAQLIGNPGFENGDTNPAPWTVSSGVINNSTSEPPHSGSWDAWLDGYGSTHTDTVSQQVTIPSTVTTATLSYWLHVDTAETDGTVHDTLQVQLFDTSGVLLATLANHSNLDANTGYAQHSVDLSAYKGRTVVVQFTGTEDASLQTSFVLDDVNLNTQ